MGGQTPAPVKGAMPGEAHSHLGCCCHLWCELMCSGLCWEADPTTPVPSSWPPTPACGFGVRDGTSGEWFGNALMHTPHDCSALFAARSLPFLSARCRCFVYWGWGV